MFFFPWMSWCGVWCYSHGISSKSWYMDEQGISCHLLSSCWWYIPLARGAQSSATPSQPPRKVWTFMLLFLLHMDTKCSCQNCSTLSTSNMYIYLTLLMLQLLEIQYSTILQNGCTCLHFDVAVWVETCVLPLSRALHCRYPSWAMKSPRRRETDICLRSVMLELGMQRDPWRKYTSNLSCPLLG